MTITYLNCDYNHKLFSFFRHDYKEITIDDKFYMLDGGMDYIRHSGGILEERDVKEVIEEIRNVFKWGRNYDENGNRLLSTKKETKAWCKSKEGLKYKEMFLLSWNDYNKGIKQFPKPTEYILLKQLTSSHICGILSYFNNRAFKNIEKFKEIEIENGHGINKQWLIFHEIFTQELDFRINNKLI